MKKTLISITTSDEQSLERGAREISNMLTTLEATLAKRAQRSCIICVEQEWMDPGERVCWKCGRCIADLKMLARPLTKRSSAKHRALAEVLSWMQDASEEQKERSPQEIQERIDELRASYTWSHGSGETTQDRYQNSVLNFLSLALYDMDLFFRRLDIVREYNARTAAETPEDA